MATMLLTSTTFCVPPWSLLSFGQCYHRLSRAQLPFAYDTNVGFALKQTTTKKLNKVNINRIE